MRSILLLVLRSDIGECYLILISKAVKVYTIVMLHVSIEYINGFYMSAEHTCTYVYVGIRR